LGWPIFRQTFSIWPPLAARRPEEGRLGGPDELVVRWAACWLLLAGCSANNEHAPPTIWSNLNKATFSPGQKEARSLAGERGNQLASWKSI